jgi:hypothetical protein
MMSEWIEWRGGECPVEKGVLVDVRYRDGVEKFSIPALELDRGRDATKYFWINDRADNDIIAYRLSETQKESGALSEQIGGNHYKQFKIQPVEYIHANGLGFCQGNVIKYVTRYKDKGGVSDLEKAKHFIDLLIELEKREG